MKKTPEKQIEKECDDLFAFIKNYIAMRDKSPSWEEMYVQFDWTANKLSKRLKRIEEHGLISRIKARHRNIRL